MADWFTPYCMPHDQCLSIGQAPSQGLVYAIDENIVLKVPFQYGVTTRPDSEDELCRDDSLRSLELLRKEAKIYRILALNPHPNILLSAVARLEELGYTHGDLAVQNIGIDGNDCLKLFDFGSATSKSHGAFSHALEKDRTGLATCMYFLLSGVDPIANAKDWSEVRCIQRELGEGRYDILPEPSVLKEIILDGWTGRAAFRTFCETQVIVESLIGASDHVSHTAAPKDYCAMEAVCVEWLNKATLEPRWLSEDRYRKEWKSLGYDIEVGRWSDG